uniref:ARID domain-containing protein n=1 Tax=Anopheles dirus TaxID=7168 RepID=A0A182N1N0_9DIPT
MTLIMCRDGLMMKMEAIAKSHARDRISERDRSLVVERGLLGEWGQPEGTPINRLPIMAKSVLDLYELYNLVIARGGLVDVINKKLWQEIIKGLHLPSSITSAAFTLRTQ